MSFEYCTTQLIIKLTDCSSGFKLNGNCYFVSDKRFSFSDSEKHCEDFGSQIAVITDNDSLNEIVNHLRTFISSRNSVKGNFWVGMTASYNVCFIFQLVVLKKLRK